MTAAWSGALPPVPADTGERSQYATVFLVLLTASLLFRLFYSPWVPLTGDELMHWQWSRHLALGYPEHPPLIAWMIAIATGVLGHLPWAVRLVSVVTVTGMFYVAFRLGRELFGDRAAFFGVAPLMATPLFNAGGVLANTDGMCGFFWITSVYAVKKAVLDRWRWGWLMFGAASGFCLLSKLPGIFLFPATLLFLAGWRQGRSWLGRWQPYGALALALVIASPPVVWNMQNGWHTISMRFGHQVSGGFTLKYFGELVGAQLLVVSPFLFPWIVWALWKCWRHRTDPRALLLGAFMLAPFGFYFSYSLFARAGVHWPGLGYITGFVAAGAFTAALSGRHPARLLAAATVPAVLLTTVLYVVPVAPQLVSRAFAYGPRPDKVSTDRLKDIFDWRELGEAVQQVMDRGSPQSFVICRMNYGVAGSVAFYTPSQPQVFLWEDPGRNGAAYEIWKRQSELRGWDAVVVGIGRDPGWFDELSCCFESIGEPELVEIRRADGELLKEYTLLHARNFSGWPPARE